MGIVIGDSEATATTRGRGMGSQQKWHTEIRVARELDGIVERKALRTLQVRAAPFMMRRSDWVGGSIAAKAAIEFARDAG